MSTELRVAPHHVTSGRRVVEIWHNGSFVGQLTIDDDATVRLISKHSLAVEHTVGTGTADDPDVVEIEFTL